MATTAAERMRAHRARRRRRVRRLSPRRRQGWAQGKSRTQPLHFGHDRLPRPDRV